MLIESEEYPSDVRRFGGWTLGVGLLASTAVAAQRAIGDADLAETLARVGRRVETYYTRARTIVCTERVLIQPLRSDLSPDGSGRRLVYELRVEWEPPASGQLAGHAEVVRRLVSVNGRPPDPKAEPGCIDPAPTSPEPLAIFLPALRNQYAFSWAGRGRANGRASVRLDYRDAISTLSEILWKGECVTISVPAKTLGRAWVDAETGDVPRLDERLAGLFDVPVPREHQAHGAPATMIIERNDTSIRYQNVRFSDPDETVVLPSTINTLSIVRNAGTPRLRVTQTFSDYKRFITGSRLVG